MELKKLTILVELPGSTPSNLQFGDETSESTIVAMFNPSKLSINRSVQWQNQHAAKRDNPEMQFTGSDPATLTIDLLFDTYDTPAPESSKQSVRTLYTHKLVRLTTVEDHGKQHRPPVCRLQWGSQLPLFVGVLQQLQVQYTMFTAGGTPVRATANCTFKQWVSNSQDMKNQALESSDVAKLWIVKRGDSLAMIAAAEYGDARAWRIIADANGVDNPLRLTPGTRLLLPARRVPWVPAVRP